MTGAGRHLPRFDAGLWQQAIEDTEGPRADVQGFFYPDDPGTLIEDEEGPVDVFGPTSGTHVVRVVSLPAGEQETWRKDCPALEYDATHRDMIREIARQGHEMVAFRYCQLMEEKGR